MIIIAIEVIEHQEGYQVKLGGNTFNISERALLDAIRAGLDPVKSYDMGIDTMSLGATLADALGEDVEEFE